MRKRIGRIFSTSVLFMIVGAIFFAGKPQPSAGQESNRKPACGCYTCKTPLTVEFEKKDKDCYGMLAADACPGELTKLPKEERGRFCDKLKTAGGFTSFKDSCPVYTQACELDGEEPPANSTGSAAGSGDIVEVEIRCPSTAYPVSPIWKQHLDGHSVEDGELKTLEFDFDGGSTVPDLYVASVSRNGQRITCNYRKSSTSFNAIYHYKVKRDIVSCVTYNSGMKCRVKD